MQNPKYVRLGSLNEPKAVSIITFLSNNADSTIVDLKAISFADARTYRILDKMSADRASERFIPGQDRNESYLSTDRKGLQGGSELNEIGGIIPENHEEEGLEGRPISHDMAHTIT